MMQQIHAASSSRVKSVACSAKHRVVPQDFRGAINPQIGLLTPDYLNNRYMR